MNSVAADGLSTRFHHRADLHAEPLGGLHSDHRLQNVAPFGGLTVERGDGHLPCLVEPETERGLVLVEAKDRRAVRRADTLTTLQQPVDVRGRGGQQITGAGERIPPGSVLPRGGHRTAFRMQSLVPPDAEVLVDDVTGVDVDDRA